MTTTDDVKDGLEGVLAFATGIAEPDRDGGRLRYRGVDVEELVGRVPFEVVWGLLADGDPGRPLAPAAQPLPLRTGSTRADVQAAVAALAPAWGLAPLVDVGLDAARDQLAHVSGSVLDLVARSARGDAAPVPDAVVEEGRTLAQRFLLRWSGDADP